MRLGLWPSDPLPSSFSQYIYIYIYIYFRRRGREQGLVGRGWWVGWRGWGKGFLLTRGYGGCGD
jgi:hypothetical protein